MTENRNFPRLHVLSYIKVSERTNDQAVGRVVDISTQGMRLMSEQPIDTSRVLQFNMFIPDTGGEKMNITFDAWVIWCRESENPGFFDSGIELRNVAASHLDAIEQFIEESSFTDRWLTVENLCPEEY